MVLTSKSLKTSSKKCKETDVGLCLQICVRTKATNSVLVNNKAPINFELIILRSFHVNEKSKDSLWNQNFTVSSNFRVVSFFNVLFLAKSSATLDLYTANGVSSYSLFNRNECPSSNEIKVLDIYCDFIRHETFILFSYSEKMEVHNVRCIKILLNSYNDEKQSPIRKTPQNVSPIPSEIVPQKYLFDPDYSQLVSAVNLISISSIQKAGNDSAYYSSDLTILTNTGFILCFMNGIMSACINIWNSIQESCNFTIPEWNMAKFDFVSFGKGSMERIAVLVDSACLLIDVEKEQVIKVWQSVLHVSKITTAQNASQRFVMVMSPTDDYKEKQRNLQLLDEKENIEIIDPYTVSSTHDTDGWEIASSLQRQSSEESNSSCIPQCAVDALLAQKKKHEISVMEARSELAAKEQFLMETWKRLQHLSLEASERFPDNSHSQLVPLLGESPREKDEEKSDEFQPSYSKHSHLNCQPGDPHTSTKQDLTPETKIHRDAHTHIEVIGQPWMRTMESLLVVGVSVRNICDRPIFGAHIHLLPVGSCSFSMVECIPSEEPTSMANYSSSASTEASSIMQPDSERTLTCFVDTAQLLCPSDMRLMLNITFSVNRSTTKLKKFLDARRLDNRQFTINCGNITLSTQDVISAKYSLEQDFIRMKSESSVDPTISMQALDCVQKSISLVVQSKISSVLCLESKLNCHPYCLAICGCHIFVADHQLRFCRVKGMRQVSKKEGKIQIFTRTDSQAVLLVKFLHSILPEDVTLLPDLPSPSLSLKQGSDILHKELQRKIDALKGDLKAAEDQAIEISALSDSENEKESGHPSSSASPTFHSKKSMTCKTKSNIESSYEKSSN
ncbi:hypothetical protein EGW08_011501, partial [Elysia chlorotica]